MGGPGGIWTFFPIAASGATSHLAFGSTSLSCKSPRPNQHDLKPSFLFLFFRAGGGRSKANSQSHVQSTYPP